MGDDPFIWQMDSGREDLEKAAAEKPKSDNHPRREEPKPINDDFEIVGSPVPWDHGFAAMADGLWAAQNAPNTKGRPGQSQRAWRF